MEKEKFTFFWNGPFSQWYPAKFRSGKFQYNCAEQYMMAEKAIHFDDLESWIEIKEATSPKEQKALGRKVKNFDPVEWDKISYDIVYKGNHLKFTQNPELLKILLESEGDVLVEASPYDKIWGIGLAEDDPRAQDRATWLGENRLGQVLTLLRLELRQTL